MIVRRAQRVGQTGTHYGTHDGINDFWGLAIAGVLSSTWMAGGSRAQRDGHNEARMRNLCVGR